MQHRETVVWGRSVGKGEAGLVGREDAGVGGRTSLGTPQRKMRHHKWEDGIDKEHFHL